MIGVQGPARRGRGRPPRPRLTVGAAAFAELAAWDGQGLTRPALRELVVRLAQYGLVPSFVAHVTRTSVPTVAALVAEHRAYRRPVTPEAPPAPIRCTHRAKPVPADLPLRTRCQRLWWRGLDDRQIARAVEVAPRVIRELRQPRFSGGPCRMCVEARRKLTVRSDVFWCHHYGCSWEFGRRGGVVPLTLNEREVQLVALATAEPPRKALISPRRYPRANWRRIRKDCRAAGHRGLFMAFKDSMSGHKE